MINIKKKRRRQTVIFHCQSHDSGTNDTFGDDQVCPLRRTTLVPSLTHNYPTSLVQSQNT